MASSESELVHYSNQPDGTYVFDHEPDIREYRITVPMSLEEYRIGHLYTTAQVSKSETAAGEGVEIGANEGFDKDLGERSPVKLQANGQVFEEGQYTKKIYYVKSKMPPYLQMLAPSGHLDIREKSYNCFPFTRSVLGNSFMKENFYCVIDSYYAADKGDTENIFELVGRELKERKVVKIDIANGLEIPRGCKPEYDPCLVGSVKTGRSPLPRDGTGEWVNNVQPLMTCYKLVRFHFKWFGVADKVRRDFYKKFERFFLDFNRQLVCTLDEYHGLTIEDIREMEKETKKELDELRRSQDPHVLA